MVDPFNHWYIDVSTKDYIIHRLMKNTVYVPFYFINNETNEIMKVYIVYQSKKDHKDILLICNRTKKRVYCDRWELAQTNPQ